MQEITLHSIIQFLMLISGMGHLPFKNEIPDRFEHEIIQFICQNQIR